MSRTNLILMAVVGLVAAVVAWFGLGRLQARQAEAMVNALDRMETCASQLNEVAMSWQEVQAAAEARGRPAEGAGELKDEAQRERDALAGLSPPGPAREAQRLYLAAADRLLKGLEDNDPGACEEFGQDLELARAERDRLWKECQLGQVQDRAEDVVRANGGVPASTLTR